MSPHKLRKLHAELRRAHDQGYAFDDEEVAAGLRCVATAVYDEHGAALAAISIAGPVTRITDDRVARLADMVRATGQSITREFGGAPR